MLRDKDIDRDRVISYFSMEIALESAIPTYSGGLGVLAGDILRSAADLEVPIVGITMVYDKGYFHQELSYNGEQMEYGFEWDYAAEFERMDKIISIKVNDKDLKVGAWLYPITSYIGHTVPVYLLDTNVEGNDEEQKNYTKLLYDATPQQRFVQELILGIGGVRMLEALGFKDINIYHMNEGHSALLTLELLQKLNGKIDDVKEKCVFTLHTPVPAGHDRFDYQLVKNILKDNYRDELRKWSDSEEQLNMTKLALYFSKFVNAVSKKHQEVSRSMFPGRKIESVTNGIHICTWLHPLMKELYENHFPALENNINQLANADIIDNEELWNTHKQIKDKLLDYEKSHSWLLLDENLFTIGLARRFTGYKRPTLIFHDLDKLGKICKEKAQIIMAGKTHPKDYMGKELIKKVFSASKYLWETYKVGAVFLENYNMDLARMLIPGVDLWLNNPGRYMEASGTSGMKAAINAVPNFSVLDGWWIEGFERSSGKAGWAIGPGPEDPNAKNRTDEEDANEIYDKLEKEIIPIYYNDKEEWIERMKCAITLGSYFNTRRLVTDYATLAWGLQPQKRWKYIGKK